MAQLFSGRLPGTVAVQGSCTAREMRVLCLKQFVVVRKLVDDAKVLLQSITLITLSVIDALTGNRETYLRKQWLAFLGVTRAGRESLHRRDFASDRLFVDVRQDLVFDLVGNKLGTK